MIIFAKVLALLWGIWWVYFGYSTGMTENMDSIGVLVRIFMPGGIFLISALFVFKSGYTAPILLILEGVFAFIVYAILSLGQYSLSTFIFIFVTMILPPVLAGSMLLYKKIEKILKQS